jgi:hypothetical protein
MKTENAAIYILWGFLGAAALFGPYRAEAQAGPGPLAPPPSQSQPQAAPPPAPAKPKAPALPARTTLAGSWKLNREESDDPQQRVRAAESADTINSNNRPRTGYPGGYPGRYPGGYPPGGYPPMGGGGPYPDEIPRGAKDIAGNPKMQPLIHPSELLSVDLKNPEVDVTDDNFHKLILYTDGRQLPKQTDNSHLEVIAHWSGSQLVSDEKSPLDGKMSRTFELSKDGHRLYESLHIDNGKSAAISIRYVYEATNSEPQSGDQESDPDRPVLKRHSDDGSNSPQ